jgi:predicted MFS family arabinose efflux permease
MSAIASAAPARVRGWVLGVLVTVYTVNFIDRQILSILLESIKLDLGLTDQALGFLAGFAFAAFYATLGIPLALWADRGNRRNLIAIALALWSGMTALCGLAQNFAQLAIARIGVGIGEAGCSPPAHSIISDYYPPKERATALGIYALGIPLGIMFGLFLGGWINEAFGWRRAFFVVGLPGLLLALVVRLTVPEPMRGQSEARQPDQARPGMRETFRFLLRRPAFLHLSFGGALAAFVGYGFVSWFPSFLIRTHGMKTTEIGLWLGLLIGIAGGIGMFLGGWLADRFGARDPRWALWTVTAAMLVSLPFGTVAYLVDDPYLALILFVVPVVASNFWQATSFAQAQGMVRLRMRAMASAILLFIANIIGLGAGPWAIGFVSDLLAPRYGADSLRWSLMLFGAMGLWVAWHFYAAGRHLARDLARVDED